MHEETYFRRRSDVETHVLPDGSCLLFDLATEKSYTLNAAGALVWEYCDGELSGAEVAQEMVDLVPQEADMERVTEELLSELTGLGLLAPMPEKDAPQ
jgi:hypothetical protein